MKCSGLLFLWITYLEVSCLVHAMFKTDDIRNFANEKGILRRKRCLQNCEESFPNRRGERFPSSSRVSLQNGSLLTMSELQIGDQVQTVSSDGHLIYSQVRAFLDKQDGRFGMYRSITTSTKTIHLSENHLIYTRKNSEKFYPKFAHEILVDDEVLVNHKDELIPEKVMNISRLIMKGTFASLTMEGNIVVDGILASCYAIHDHDMAHFAVTPIAWVPGLIEFFNVHHESPGYAKLVDDVSALWFDTWATILSA